MPRYRAIGQNDDPSLETGDDSFVGVNSFDSPENLDPGQVQAAVNMDFTTQDGVTRGGFVCLPALGSIPFGAWASQQSAADDAWLAITFGNNTFVAVSSNFGGVMTSQDGITWTLRSAAAADQWNAVCYGNGLFVAVSNVGNVMTSPTGTTWTLRSAAAANQWTGITFGNGLFVAVSNTGTGNRVMTSPDGITWTSRANTFDVSWTDVAFGNGTFVAVENSPGTQVMISSNGITWFAHSAAVAGQWSSLTYGNGLFVAVRINGTGNRVMTSPDGVTWTIRSSPTSTDANDWRKVAFGGGLFAAASSTGTGNRVMTSPDGITWTYRTSAADNNWFGIAFGNGIFAAVSTTGTGDRVMIYPVSSVFASGIYSDPNDAGSQWIMLVGTSTVGFFAFGRQSRTLSITSGNIVSQQSTVVQCGNQVYIFRGPDNTPLYWDGNWSGSFTVASTATPPSGFSIIPDSNQATYYQNRLWVIDGKDTVAASDILGFNIYDKLANAFNVNTGSSDYLVTTYPFGTETLIVFKNKSILTLAPVSGTLAAVSASEITRQVGIIGINAVVSVGSDVVYMSDRNVNLISLTDTNNALQHQTLPLSRNIQSIIRRVNWNVASKVSMAYWDNKLFVSLPLDNATSCNTVVVYNFVTQQWFGEWSFAASIGMEIQGWVVATYLGATRLHCITEDGRIFVTNEGQNDISGTIVAEISTSLTTRAYKIDNGINFVRRMYADLGTNRPNFSITAYADGASENTTELSGQTYSRSSSWIFGDTTYNLNNSSDDYNRAGRQDYSTGPNSIQCGTGFQPEMAQAYRYPLITRRKGRLAWFKIANTTGRIEVNSIGMEARAGDRTNLVQVI